MVMSALRRSPPTFSPNYGARCQVGPPRYDATPPSEPDRDPTRPKELLRLEDGVSSVVKDGSSKCSTRLPLQESIGDMLQGAATSGCDHRDRHTAGDGPVEEIIVSQLSPIAIHRREKYLPRTAL